MKATNIAGIDFGTSGLRFQRAVVGPDGQLKAQPQEAALQGAVQGGALPSVLEVDLAQQEILSYGRPALNKLLNRGNGSAFIQEFKPCLGQAPEDMAAQGRPAIAQVQTCPKCGAACSGSSLFCARCGGALTSLSEADSSVLFRYSQDDAFLWAGKLLGRVRSDLETRIYGEPLNPANGWGIVAGVPVHWKAATRERFQELLVKSFGNDQVQLVSEPEAAVYYHLWRETLHRSIAGSILLVDIGAGTTDFVMGELKDGGKRLAEAQSYGERYGGGDFDTAIAAYVAQELNIPLDSAMPPALKMRSKELKEQFSAAVSDGEDGSDMLVSLMIDGQPYNGMVSLDRSTFESQPVAGPLVTEFGAMMERALTHFGTAQENIAAVILTGGGAHWYFVRDAMNKLFAGKPVLTGEEPERAIVRGLALAPVYLLEHSSAQPIPEVVTQAQDTPPEQKEEVTNREVQFIPVSQKDVSTPPKIDATNDLMPTDDPVDQSELGERLYREKDYDGAITAYRKLVEQQPFDALAHSHLGDSFYAKKEWGEALAAFREAVRLAPDVADYRHKTGLCLSGQKEWGEALVEIREALRIKPNEALYHAWAAECLKELQQWDEALWEYQEALKLDPALRPKIQQRVSMITASRPAHISPELRRAVGIAAGGTTQPAQGPAASTPVSQPVEERLWQGGAKWKTYTGTFTLTTRHIHFKVEWSRLWGGFASSVGTEDAHISLSEISQFGADKSTMGFRTILFIQTQSKEEYRFVLGGRRYEVLALLRTQLGRTE